MAEYIDKEEINFGSCKEYILVSGTPYVNLNEIARKIKSVPVADVAPVKHGKWIWNPNGMDWGLGAWLCSECHNRNGNLPMDNKINPSAFSGSNFCPNCGAKMDLGS